MTCLFTFVCSKVDRLFHYSHYRKKIKFSSIAGCDKHFTNDPAEQSSTLGQLFLSPLDS